MSRYTGTPGLVETRREVTDFDLEAFRCRLVDMFERHRAAEFPNLDPEPVTVRKGRRYARFFQGTSCYCFVDLGTGEILKPETFKKPAKHARGSLHNQEPLVCCGPYGVAYLS